MGKGDILFIMVTIQVSFKGYIVIFSEEDLSSYNILNHTEIPLIVPKGFNFSCADKACFSGDEADLPASQFTVTVIVIREDFLSPKVILAAVTQDYIALCTGRGFMMLNGDKKSPVRCSPGFAVD